MSKKLNVVIVHVVQGRCTPKTTKYGIKIAARCARGLIVHVVHVQNMNNMNNKVASAAIGDFYTIFSSFGCVTALNNMNNNNVKLFRPSKSKR